MPTTTLIGWCQEGKGDLLAAIESHQNARQMAETAVSLTGSIGSLSKLSMLYAKIGQNDAAATCFEQVITFAEQRDGTQVPLLGMAYIGAGQMQGDSGLIEKGIELCKPWGGLHIEVLRGYGVLLSILQQQGKTAELAKKREEAQQFVSNNHLPSWVLTLLKSNLTTSLIDPLTAREQEVLQWLARGQTVPQIATELVVSPSTIRTHIKRIYAKLNAHSRHEAVQNGRKQNLIP
ncbi:MAG: hypothetical protein GY805_12145 [Chloroflexi bacterium]|nr:hypothetical protein [Chloroflexota bacterium]